MVLFTTKILMILGISNFLFLLLISSSCRCMGFHALTNKLFQYNWYKKFYSYHCYYWYGLWLSVTLHAVIALSLFGWPF